MVGNAILIPYNFIHSKDPQDDFGHKLKFFSLAQRNWTKIKKLPNEDDKISSSLDINRGRIFHRIFLGIALLQK